MGNSVLRIPQARVLRILRPEDATTYWIEWPCLTAREIARVMGTSEVSDFTRRAIRGLPEGSPSGTPHSGLLALGYVVELFFDIDGVREIRYRVTPEGIAAIDAYLALGKMLPALKDRASCINARYAQE